MKREVRIIVCRLTLLSALVYFMQACSSQPAEPTSDELTTRWIERLEQRELKMDELEGKRRHLLASVNEQVSMGDMKFSYMENLVDEVMKKGAEIDRKFDKWDSKLENIAGWNRNTGAFKYPEERIENKKMWKVDGNGSELTEFLDEFADWINEFRIRTNAAQKGPVASLARPSSESGNWIDETFSEHTVVHNLIALEEIRMKCIDQCITILDEFQAEIPIMAEIMERPKIDSIYFAVKPKSERVKAGEKFEAVITFMPEGSGIKPEFSGDGSFELMPGGEAVRVTIKALGGFAPGQSEKKQSYSVKAKVPGADGVTHELIHNGTFTVIK